ncbi:MAG: aminoacyltransferase [Erysipelothrix sp.]|nr:aminoacyltransferase [Erysipelothrix sp.]
MIKKITYEQFLEFAKENQQVNVLQSIEHAKRLRRDYEYLALIEGDSIVGAGLFTYRPVFFGYREATCQLGPVLDYHQPALVETFFKELKTYLKTKKVYYLLFNPNLIRLERDINGDIVENGVNNTSLTQTLENLGMDEVNIDNHPYLINWYFVKDLSDIHDSEELLESFASKTKQIIRRSLELGVRVRPMSFEEIPLFKKFMDEAANKHHFIVRSQSYYEDLYQQFVLTNHGVFLVAYYEKEELVSYYQNKIDEDQTLIDKTPDTNKRNRNIIKEANIRLDSFRNKLEIAQNIEAKDGFVYLGAAMFYLYEHEMIYFNSGMREETKSFEAPYVIQFEAMKLAIENNIKRYNFYGTNGHFNNKPAQHGIYEFKKGFGGVVEEMLGFYSLNVNPTVLKIINLLKKVANRN